MSGLIKVCGAILFGLVFCAGAGASGTTTTTTMGRSKHHSAGTAHVATRLTAHTSVSHAAATRTVAHGRGHGAQVTLAVRRTRYRNTSRQVRLPTI